MLKPKKVPVIPEYKMSPEEAGIFDLDMPDNTRVVAVANLNIPFEDDGFMEAFEAFLAKERPHYLFLLGGIVNHEAVELLINTDQELGVRRRKIPAEVLRARAFSDDHVERIKYYLTKEIGPVIKRLSRFAEKTIWIPACRGTRKSLSNEYEIYRFVHNYKTTVDFSIAEWREKYEKAKKRGKDFPKPPSKKRDLPRDFAQLFGLHREKNIRVLPFGGAVSVNCNTLFLEGDFKRRHEGDASKVDFEQWAKSIVGSYDGKLASLWFTKPWHSYPSSMRRNYQCHEIGHGYDRAKMGHMRHYERRHQGFWYGVCYKQQFFASTYPFIRGISGKRSFVVHGRVYEEKTIGGLPNGGRLTFTDKDFDLIEKINKMKLHQPDEGKLQPCPKEDHHHDH